MQKTTNPPEQPQSLGTTESPQLRAVREKKWAKYDAMALSVIAACERHLALIKAEQTRADTELVAKARNQGAAK
jgi:hypothetical protein